jgi:hypothetical protein
MNKLFCNKKTRIDVTEQGLKGIEAFQERCNVIFENVSCSPWPFSKANISMKKGQNK